MEEKQMKMLILVRHGDYCGEQLTGHGREMISALSKKLKQVVGKKKVRILTSTAGRARESAEILSEAFGVSHEQHEILRTDYGCSLEGALNLVRSCKGSMSVLILVTHIEYVEDFPRYFGTKELNASLDFYRVEKGEAIVVDCKRKTAEHLYL